MFKKSVFSWQIIEFLNDLLEFFENLLEFFFGLSFFGLEFFSKCPKKAWVLSECFIVHIFPKAQVASNKNAHKLWHHFWAQFFMLFHIVWSILFRVLALKTLKWKFLIGCWRISTNEKVVSRPNTPNKMNHTKWKSMKNCAQKWCQKLCAFLLEVTCDFWKMCFIQIGLSQSKFSTLDKASTFNPVSEIGC